MPGCPCMQGADVTRHAPDCPLSTTAPFVVRRAHPDNAPCKFDGSIVDVNGACIKCGSPEGEDCRDF